MSHKRALFTIKDFVLLCVLFIFVLIWFHNVIIYDNILSYGDLGQYFYQVRAFSAEAIKDLRIPLWNPYIKCGTPFLATLQSCVFYPLSVICYLPFSFDQAFNWYIIIHFFLAAAFMYLLMRHWKASRTASLVASLVFVFGGYLSSVITMNTSMSSVIWIPLILLFFDMAVKRRRFLFALITGLLLGFQFLGGEPTIIYGTLWLLVFYSASLAYISYKKERSAKKVSEIWLLFLVAAVSWIFFTMVQFLPFAELLIRSSRAGAQGFDFVSHWSLLPVEAVSFFIPFALGNITLAGGHLNIQDWMASLYIGIMPIMLIALTILVKSDRKSFFFVFIFAVSIVLAMGRHTPVYAFLHRFILGFGHIRYPVKFVFLAAFAASVLAGLGLDKVLRIDDEAIRARVAKRLILLNGFLALATVFFLRFWNEIYSFFVKFSLSGRSEVFNYMQALRVVYLSDSAYIYRLFILFTISALALALYLNRNIRLSVFSLLAVAIVFFDLSGVNMGISKTANKDLFKREPQSFLEVKKDGGLSRVIRTEDIRKLNKGIWGANYGLGQYERKVTFDGNTPMQHGIYDSQGYGSISRQDQTDFMDMIYSSADPFGSRLVDLLNIRYVISTEPLQDSGYEVVYQGDVAGFPIICGGRMYMHFFINKNSACMDRAFLVEGAQVANGRDEALTILDDEAFDPHKVVVLDEEPVLISRPQVREALIKDRVHIVSYKSEEVIISASVNKPKFLVLSDSYYPGWRVYVDGKLDKLYRANYFLRGVYLDRGDHAVRFVFRPASYRIGMYITLASLGLLIVAVAAGFSRRRLQ